MFVIYFYEMHIKIEAIIREQKFYLCARCGTVALWKEGKLFGKQITIFSTDPCIHFNYVAFQDNKEQTTNGMSRKFCLQDTEKRIRYTNHRRSVISRNLIPIFSVVSTNSGRKQRSNGEPAEELEYFNITLPFASNLFCLFNYSNKIISS